MRKVIGEFVYEHWHQHQFIEKSKSVRIAKIFAIKDLFAGSKGDVNLKRVFRAQNHIFNLNLVSSNHNLFDSTHT